MLHLGFFLWATAGEGGSEGWVGGGGGGGAGRSVSGWLVVCF